MPAPIDELVPCLPETAPFSPEQRAYLNGFLAGLFSRELPQVQSSNSQKPPANALVPLTILFGSQTGNAENLAKRAAKEAGKRGFAPTVHDLGAYSPSQLVSEHRVLIITSTYGDGEPPDNAKVFWNLLGAREAPNLSAVQFSVCALGDSNYPAFCGFGKNLDQRLESLGARRLHPRTDCDVEFEEHFAKWLNEVLNVFHLNDRSRRREEEESHETNERTGGWREGPREPICRESRDLDDLARGNARPTFLWQAPAYSRTNPFPAPLLANKKLNRPGSSKDTRHFEFSLKDSGLTYKPGDALGVLPTNCPDLVNDILAALQRNGDELVPGGVRSEEGTPASSTIPLRDALLHYYEITRIPRSLLSAMAARSGDDLLKKLCDPHANGELTSFLHGREIIDLLLAHPSVRFGPVEFVSLLKKPQPRLYSIASSQDAFAEEVHLTVNIVRYESLARQRKGVCSTFLADRVSPASRVPIFVHSNKNFRPPPDPSTPMIMVGPGTGIAPFRAFLQERRALGATGKNWLFFGDQRSATDFMYREEFEAMVQNGFLTRLDTAFSRDQSEKIYAQHRMRESAKELFAWLEAGAHFYVCGDASRMAKDVDAALHQIIESASGLTSDRASDYVARLKTERRYQRDIY